VTNPQNQMEETFYLTQNGDYIPTSAFIAGEGGEPMMIVKNGTEFYLNEVNLKRGEGYKDLHSLVLSFFGHDKTKDGFPAKNDMALFAVLFYVFAMIALGFHLWHGFAAAFQSLGANHKRYNNLIKVAGRGFAVIIPALFAIIPVILFMTK
jgi:succinate dehydrogenase / fumarate reductase cytochrome b subunit